MLRTAWRSAIGGPWRTEGKESDLGARKIAVNGSTAFGIYEALLPASTRSGYLFPRLPSKDQFICVPWLPMHLYPTMTFIDLDTAQFYQPPTRPGQCGDRRVAALNCGVPTAHKERNSPVSLRPSNELSARLEDYDLIECVDLTGPPPTELLDLFCEPALDLNGAEVHAGGKGHRLWFGWTVINESSSFKRT